MRLGLGLHMMSTTGGAAVFDPATLSNHFWWRAPYAGMPSASQVGGNLTQGVSGVSPAVGTAVNGYDPMSFNGTTQSADSASAISSFMTDVALGFALLVKPAAATPDPGANNRNAARTLMSDGAASGYMGVTVLDTGFAFYIFDGSYKDYKHASSDPTGSWSGAFGKISGGTLNIRRNADAYGAGVAVGSIDLMTGLLTFSNGFGGSEYSGDIMEIMIRQTPYTGTEEANIYAYWKARYPAMGLP